MRTKYDQSRIFAMQSLIQSNACCHSHVNHSHAQDQLISARASSLQISEKRIAAMCAARMRVTMRASERQSGKTTATRYTANNTRKTCDASSAIGVGKTENMHNTRVLDAGRRASHTVLPNATYTHTAYTTVENREQTIQAKTGWNIESQSTQNTANKCTLNDFPSHSFSVYLSLCINVVIDAFSYRMCCACM